MVNNIKIGADPELFLSKNNEIISAEGYIGGTKDKPKYISEKGHAIQEDNVMIEFNIPPCTDSNSFIKEINFVKTYLEQLVVLYDCELNYSASAFLNKKYLKTPQAQRFGCDPDLNVYLKEINDSPSSNTNLRTCGGHIHVGYDDPSFEVSELIIYAMDITLGLESLLLDKDTERRKMYGNAGCFRPKDYGVEYRTLSNFWIKDNKLIEWAYNNTIKAIELVNTGIITDLVKEFGDNIKETIDSNDKKKAKQLINKINKQIQKKICVES
jgi:hypothetical protein